MLELASLLSPTPSVPPLPAAELPAVFAELARIGALLVVHAEDPEELAGAPQPLGPRYADFLASCKGRLGEPTYPHELLLMSAPLATV